MSEHLNVTVVFGEQRFLDLRVPSHLPIEKFIEHICETVHAQHEANHFCVKVVGKELLLRDDDLLVDFPVCDGDILQVLM